jgi:hypothetical protein
MTDARQQELSDRWQEALQIRRWIEEIWASGAPPDAVEPTVGPAVGWL